MEIQTTIEIIPASNDEIKKDREYHLKCYRVKKAIQKINEISRRIALGELCVDESTCAVISGMRWVK